MTMQASQRIGGIAILSLIILICVYLFLHSSFFNVNKVYVTGLNQLTEDEILRLSEISEGVNIFEVNNRLAAKAVELHPMVKEASIIRHLPRKLEIRVSERKVWAVIPYNNQGLFIDEEGICIDRRANYSLLDYPIITMETMPAKINLGQAVNAKGITEIRKLWKAMEPEQRKFISDFRFINSKDEIIAYTVKGTEIKFGNTERLEEKIKFFQYVITLENNMEKDGSDVLEYVDLRYKGQPVIKTKA